MKKFIKRNIQLSDELLQVENYLQTMLKPVVPDADYVDGLKARLMHTSFNQDNKFTLWHYLAFSAAGLMSLVFITMTGIRAITTILGTLGLIRYVKSQSNQKGSVPVHRAV